jgi:hypothetical protein
MKHLLRLLFLCSSLPALAQTPREEWRDEYSPIGNLSSNTHQAFGYTGNSRVFLVGRASGGTQSRVDVWQYGNEKSSKREAQVFSCQAGLDVCQEQATRAQPLRDGGLVVLAPRIVRFGNDMSRRDLSDQKGVAADILSDPDRSLAVLLEDNKTIVVYNGQSGAETGRMVLPDSEYRGISHTSNGGIIAIGSFGARVFSANGQPQPTPGDAPQAHSIRQLSNGDFIVWGDYAVLRFSHNFTQKGNFNRGFNSKLDIKHIDIDDNGNCFVVRPNESVKLSGESLSVGPTKPGGDGGFQWSNGDFCVWKNGSSGTTFTKYEVNGNQVWESGGHGGTVSGHPASDGGFFIVGYQNTTSQPAFIRKMTSTPAAPVCEGRVSIAGNSSFCEGTSTTLTAQATNAPNASFTWSGPKAGTGATLDITEGGTGTYRVVMSYGDNCPAREAAFPVTRHNRPTARAGTNATVTGGTNSYTIQGTTAQGGAGGYHYEWRASPGATITPNESTNAANPTISGLSVGTTTLTLRVRDSNDCWSEPSQMQITYQPCALSVTLTAEVTEFCAGGKGVLRATVNNPSGVSYQWKRRNGNNWENIAGANSERYEPDQSGTYRIEVSANGCSDAKEMTVTKSEPRVTIRADATEFCAGGSTTLRAEPSGGIGNYQHAWKKDGTATGGTDETLTGVKGGAYTVEVTDRAGCKATSGEQRITENPIPTANAGGNVTKYGNDKHTPVASASGGTPGYSWEWSTSPGVPISPNNTTQRPEIGPFSQTTELTFKVRDSKGCEATAKAQVTYSACPLQVTIANGSVDYCAGAIAPTLTLNPSGQEGTLGYVWKRDGNAVGGNTATLSAGESGRYTVTVTDSRCSATSEPITVRRINPVVSIQEPTSRSFCEGQSLTLRTSATGGEGLTPQYEWRNGAISGGSGAELTVTQTGDYSVTVRYGACTSPLSNVVRLTRNPSPTATVTGPTAFCTTTSATLTASTGSGYQWQWQRDGQPVGSSQQLQVTQPGTYRVLITDGNGCQRLSSDHAVAMHQEPRVRIHPAASRTLCVGTDLQFVQGHETILSADPYGATGYTYRWMRNGSPLSNNTAEMLYVNQPGTYVVEATGGCGSKPSDPVEVKTINADINARITPAVSVLTSSTPSVTISAHNDPSYVYKWMRSSTGETARGTGSTLTVAEPDTVVVQISRNGCVVRSNAVRVERLTRTPETLLRVTLYPNPTTERVRLEVSTPQSASLSVQLLSAQGQAVGTWKQPVAPAHAVELDLRDLPDGLYFLHLRAGTHHEIRKLIRSR